VRRIAPSACGALPLEKVDPGLIFIKVALPGLGQEGNMKPLGRILSCLLLTLALMAAGPGGAGHAGAGAAGAGPGAVMLLDLCSGDLPGTVWLDAEGNPVDPGAARQHCPDCLVFSALPPQAAVMPAARSATSVPLDPILRPRPAPAAAAHLRPTPRAPPAAPALCRSAQRARPAALPPAPAVRTALSRASADAARPASGLRVIL
jgi:hypothetical protein